MKYYILCHLEYILICYLIVSSEVLVDAAPQNHSQLSIT